MARDAECPDGNAFGHRQRFASRSVITHRWGLARLGLDLRQQLIRAAPLGCILTPGLGAQPMKSHLDSLQLRYMRIRAQSTDSCKVLVSTSGSMNIATYITPANAHRWIDTAAAYARAAPHREKGQRIRYAWIPITLGVSRTITDRFDAFEFVIGGHGIPITAREIPRIAKLLETAATQTLKQSRTTCPTTPDR